MTLKSKLQTLKYAVVVSGKVKWKHVPLSEETGEGEERVFRTTEDVEISMPDGSIVFADAEVSDPDGSPIVTMSLLENDELTLAIRSNSAVSVRYITRVGCEVLLSVGDPK